MNTNYIFFLLVSFESVPSFPTLSWSLPPPLYSRLLKFNTPNTFRWFFACQIWKLVPPFQVLSWILSPSHFPVLSKACPFPSLSGPQLQFAPYSKSLLWASTLHSTPTPLLESVLNPTPLNYIILCTPVITCILNTKYQSFIPIKVPQGAMTNIHS